MVCEHFAANVDATDRLFDTFTFDDGHDVRETVAHVDHNATERRMMRLRFNVLVIGQIGGGCAQQRFAFVFFEKDFGHRLLNGIEIELGLRDDDRMREIDRSTARAERMVPHVFLKWSRFNENRRQGIARHRRSHLYVPVNQISLLEAENVEQSGRIAAFVYLVAYEWSATF